VTGASPTPQGERAAGARPALEEACAAELRGVPGVGEATAAALACTSALGGRPHGSLAGLRAWAAADGHAAALLAFLLHRRGPVPAGLNGLLAGRRMHPPSRELRPACDRG